MMKRGVLVALSWLVAAPLGAFSQSPGTPVAPGAIDASQAPFSEEPKSVEECSSSWLNAQHLKKGPNERESGMMFVAEAKFEVKADKGSKSWVAARNAAFLQSELTARKSLADLIGTELRSRRAASVLLVGGDEPPPSLNEPAAQISNAEKLSVLNGLALDNAIRQFDPTWTGAGKTEEQKREKAVTELASTIERIAARSEIFASGAFTAEQCEGPDEDGRYSVLVDLIWSPKLQAIADSLVNPEFRLPPEAPKQSIIQQLAALSSQNPHWMAFTQGTRVWTNEMGERVIVGFGVAPTSSLASADRGRAHLLALAAIQRFVGEKIEAQQIGKEEFATVANAAHEQQTFDTSSYEQRISGASKTIELVGATEIASWRNKHPWSGNEVQVVAVAWSPTSRVIAEGIKSSLATEEAKSKKLGNVPDSTISEVDGRGDAVAAPVSSGASTDASSF